MKNRINIRIGLVILVLGLSIAAAAAFFRDDIGGLSQRPQLRVNGTSFSSDATSGEFSSLRTLYRTIHLVQKSYLDASRIDSKKMLLSAMHEVQTDVAQILIKERGDTLSIKLGAVEKSFPLSDIKTPWILLQRTKEIFSFIKENTKKDEINFQDLEYAAINGMLKTLDPHTVLLTPEVYRDMKDRTQGNFGGLGIVISIRDGVLTVISPIDGTPADKAGLNAGDQVIKIDESSTVNMPLNDAVSLMRGKPGTSVTLHILRKNWEEPRPFKITRAIIKVRSVDSEMMSGNIGYIRIGDFQANTASDLLSHMDKLGKKGRLRGLVLDLQNNPGGLLTAAIQVADVFLKEGVIVTTAGQGLAMREVRNATNIGKEPSYPIIVLVNSGSASASEIVAGALKNHGRALLVGERTFGKGSVQVLHDFQDGSALKLTTAQYLTPGDISIQSVGVVPHIELQQIRADEELLDLKKAIQIRESDLQHHFESSSQPGKATEAAQVTLQYLYTPKKKPKKNDKDNVDNGDSSESTATSDDDDTEGTLEDEDSSYNFVFKPDFKTNLARDIAIQLSSSKEDILNLNQLEGIFKQKKQQEERKIIAALAKQNIDWSPGNESTKPQLDISVQIDNPLPLAAGSENTLQVTVTNKGEGTLYRLLALSRSDFRALDQKELAIGRLSPGKTITRTIKFKVSKDARAKIDDVKITLTDMNQNTLPSAATRFAVKPLLAPRFAYSNQLLDYQHGNGDGMLQIGEKVTLLTTVKNVGRGKALSTYATLRNSSGNNIFLTTGREDLKEMAVGETRQVSFKFTVKPEFKKASAKFEMSIMDIELKAYTGEKIELPIQKAIEVTDFDAIVAVGAEGASLMTSPSPKAAKIAFIPAQTKLQTVSKTGAHYRVTIGKNQTGWIPQSAVAISADSEEQAHNNAFVEAINTPPKVVLHPFDAVVKKKEFTLSGYATDESVLRDIYIFVGDDKVFFKSNPKKTAPSKMKFSTTVSLEYGMNYIAVIAEETADLETREVITIRRDRKDGMPFIASYDLQGTPEPLGILPTVNAIPIKKHIPPVEKPKQ